MNDVVALEREIAELRRQLAESRSAYGERIAHQAATIDVLKAMSATPGDPQPVFDLIVQQAKTLLDTPSTMLFQYDGELLHFRADAGTADLLGRDVMDGLLRSYPMAPHRGTVSGRAILDAAVVHVRDLTADPDRSTELRALPYRSQFSVPLLRDGRSIGVLTSASSRVDAFSDAQIALLKTFAEQAVIAITSAETYRALQERTAALARRNSEYGERIEHQAATIDVLKAMSASPGDPRPVFELIAQRARDICGGYGVSVFEYDGALMHLRAYTGVSDNPAIRAEYEARFPMPPPPDVPSGMAILERRTAQIDITSGTVTGRAARDGTVKSGVGVPMLRGQTVIGALGMGSREAGGFSETQIELLKTFAEQAVIAITSAETYRALQVRTAELAERNTSFAEQIDHQAATIDVLKAMSTSPGDARPALEMIALRAWALCGKRGAVLYRVDGPTIDVVVYHRPDLPAERLQAFREYFPKPVDMMPMAKAITERRILHVRDSDTWPDGNDAARILFKSAIWVPLLRGETVIGLIGLDSLEYGGFSDSQVELLKTFAEQAVIAITSAETYRALQDRTADLQESLEYQTATSDVLKAISRSTFDLQPVLDTLVTTAARLCEAENAFLMERDGDLFRAKATLAMSPAEAAILQSLSLKMDRGTITGRAALEGRVVQIEDVTTDPEYALTQTVSVARNRTLLGVPLLRQGVVVGVIALGRQRVRAFNEQQIALVSTFADQAVIAMANARLLTEQREALERQTATAEVLQVINTSPGDLQPVFDTILEKAHGLCDAPLGALVIWDGEHMRAVATHGFPNQYSTRLRQPFPPSLASQSLLDGARLFHVPDAMNLAPDPRAQGVQDTGARTALLIPLRKEGELLGYISSFRKEVRPFSDKEIALLENFAAQAVIAMENARLLTEQREALERQTATAEVLEIINVSPGDLAPVFDAILEKAHALCGATIGSLFTYDGEQARAVATHGLPDEFAGILRQGVPLTDGVRHITAGGTRSGQTPDVRAFQGPTSRFGRFLVERTDVRTVLLVPLRKDDAFLGYISAMRPEVRPFSEKEIALLENFAAQAVIAMENARLLTEQQEALEQQTATAEVLQVINASPGNLAPVFDAMLEKAMRLCGVAFGSFHTWDGESTRFVAMRGFPPEIEAYVAARGPSRAPGPWVLTMAETRRPFQYDDLRSSEAYLAGQPDVRAFADLGGVRTGLVVPLVKDQTLIGYVVVYRLEVRPFSDKEIALLENFAAQAVIAMDNARLLTEQREALERQTATAEVLQVINTNPGNLTPVFNAILEKAVSLCESSFGILNTYDGQLMRMVATHGLAPEQEALFPDRPPAPGQPTGRIAAGEDVVHLLDARDQDGYRAGFAPTVNFVDQVGARSVIWVALRKEATLLGIVSLFRREVRAFSHKEIALAKNFAAQAVIAMENARLLTETREALEQQTATAEVLQVINASPGDLTPVFDAILNKAHTLCGAAIGSLYTWDGGSVWAVATHGLPEDYAAFARQKNPPNFMIRPLIEGERYHHVPDVKALEPTQDKHASTFMERTDARTILLIPLRKDGAFAGFITAVRTEVRPFVEKEIALLENFAAQAVIAMENARLLTEQREALEQQTATAEVLAIINESPGHLVPVFDTILEKALTLSEAAFGTLWTFDTDSAAGRIAATRNIPSALAEFRAAHPPSGPSSLLARVLGERRTIHQLDIREDESYRAGHAAPRSVVELGGARTLLLVPLLKDQTVLGTFQIYRQEVRAFTDRQISLVESFAAQAVIAIENARLLTEQREALERQTAMADVLQVINASPGNLVPVFDAIMERSLRLGGAEFGALYTYDGERFHMAAIKGVPPEFEEYRRRYPQPTGVDSPPGQLLATKRPVQVQDNMTHPFFVANPNERDAQIRLGGVRAVLALPLLKDGAVTGQLVIYRKDPGIFPDKQVALLENFAAQAVIAMENARLLTEQREALERQTAMAEVLRVINTNPGNLRPVFDIILAKAHAVCGADVGGLFLWNDTHSWLEASLNYPEPLKELLSRPRPLEAGLFIKRLTEEPYVHIPDCQVIAADINRTFGPGIADYAPRTVLAVALRRDRVTIGHITANRLQMRPYTSAEISLLESFAAQAVIAMENARLLTEQREALERQTAMADLLGVINANPGNLAPVFEAILEKAHSLCGVDLGALNTIDGDVMRAVATRGYSPEAEMFSHIPRPAPALAREALARGERFVHLPDLPVESGSLNSASMSSEHRRAFAAMGARTSLTALLCKDNVLIGIISAYRTEVKPFSDKEIALLENFAAQAVIAMDNARLLNEIRQRQSELNITFENMGDGVAMFDREQKLAAWNRNFQDILDLPDDAVRVGLPFADYIRGLAEKGEYGPDANADEQITRLTALLDQANRFERTRPNGRVIDIRQNPIPGGGFVVIYADITERKHAEEALRIARDEAETALRELKLAQANLVQAEKMASLGQLTAGIAHEIKNPLNFVNNFASLSVELLDDLKQTAAPAFATLSGDARADVEDLAETLTGNLKKIEEHGKRADGIVRSMLEHSRGSSSERRAVDINELVDEALNLAYHGARAQDQNFNITLERDYASDIAPVTLAPQDMTRVLLNLIGNGFYAARKRREAGVADFEPMLKVATRDLGDAVEFRVRDNGIGIPPDIRDKLFQPFFTTKPTGEGTGLGLSITWDVVTKAHAGTITVDSEPGDHTEFTVTLPRHATGEGARP